MTLTAEQQILMDGWGMPRHTQQTVERWLDETFALGRRRGAAYVASADLRAAVELADGDLLREQLEAAVQRAEDLEALQ